MQLNLSENLTFYRINNREEAETFLRVYDADSYEVSKSLNIEDSVIEDWNSRQGQGNSLDRRISYTKWAVSF